ncbi:hypothetical protein GCM10027570_02850 [Streptomonospora sediminis]
MSTLSRIVRACLALFAPAPGRPHAVPRRPRVARPHATRHRSAPHRSARVRPYVRYVRSVPAPPTAWVHICPVCEQPYEADLLCGHCRPPGSRAAGDRLYVRTRTAPAPAPAPATAATVEPPPSPSADLADLAGTVRAWIALRDASGQHQGGGRDLAGVR